MRKWKTDNGWVSVMDDKGRKKTATEKASAKPSVAIIGAGVLGTALGRALSLRGYSIAAIASRKISSARRASKFIGYARVESDIVAAARQGRIVFITTSDGAIGQVCESIATKAGFIRDALVLHCSGIHSSDVLSPARECGAMVASMHPLQSFADVSEAVRLFRGTYFAYEGDVRADSLVRGIIRDLGGVPVKIRTDEKPLYHGAAVVVCNYLVTLFEVALRMFEEAGIRREEGRRALIPLLRGTVSNIEKLGLPRCLTGPIARGDIQTVMAHLSSITRRLPEVLDLYKLLGRMTIEVGLAKGSLSRENATRLRRLLS